MKTITKTYEVYNFNELGKNAKQKAKELWYDESEVDIQNEHFQEFANELLCLLGFESGEVSYSLSSSQGDGLAFDFNINTDEMLNIFNMINNLEVKEKGYQFLEDVLKKISNNVGKIDIREEVIKGLELTCKTDKNYYSNHYSHSRTRDIEVTSQYDYQCDFNDKTTAYILYLEDTVKNIYFTICNTLEKEGYEQIYYVADDVEFGSMMEEGGMEFNEDGTLFY